MCILLIGFFVLINNVFENTTIGLVGSFILTALVYSHLILLYPTLNIKLYEGYSINWDVLGIILRKIVWNV